MMTKWMNQPAQLLQGGGIIIQRNAVVLRAMLDPCFYSDLSTEDKNTLEVINAKAPGARTAEDLAWMVDKLKELCSC